MKRCYKYIFILIWSFFTLDLFSTEIGPGEVAVVAWNADVDDKLRRAYRQFGI
jgi:hypothetical protein